MVSTRSHPSTFPAPAASPAKSSPRKSPTSTAAPAPAWDESPTVAAPSMTRRAVEKAFAASENAVNVHGREHGVGTMDSVAATNAGAWNHTASNVTLAWIAMSLPLVIWDSLYILLRPHTMAGGALQWPIWKPYEIYAAIDYVYGQPGWDDRDGFGGGQGAMNALEVVLYGLYLMIVYNHGIRGSGFQIGEGVKGWMNGGVKVRGKTGNQALLIGFSASLMTLSKTVLYYLVEYYSGFKNTAHNDWFTLMLFYGVMNGLWIVFPAYMTVTFGSDILAGLNAATDAPADKNN